jgi:hypothetical protein
VPHVEQAGHRGGIRATEDVCGLLEHVVDVVVGQQDVRDVERKRQGGLIRGRRQEEALDVEDPADRGRSRQVGAPVLQEPMERQRRVASL